jgi:ribosomal protein L29
MKFKELSALSKSERDKKMSELKMELLKLNAQVSQGTVLKSPGQVKVVKKTIARLNTITSNEA